MGMKKLTLDPVFSGTLAAELEGKLRRAAALHHAESGQRSENCPA
jgi:hypothetical protein